MTAFHQNTLNTEQTFGVATFNLVSGKHFANTCNNINNNKININGMIYIIIIYNVIIS